MRQDRLLHYRTGVLIPVAALRTPDNPGIGEFADLPELARWCIELGLDTIQLLPVNDSGGESSPYSALSAFALHPIYLRITDLPEMKSLPKTKRHAVEESLNELRTRHQDELRIRYREMLDGKLDIIRRVFESTNDSGRRSDMDRFIAENSWIRAYAVFKHLKRENEERSWLEWPTMRDPTPNDIEAAWSDPEFAPDIAFDVWLQMRLHEQLSTAAAEVNDLGVMLKGDLPILMNDDSVDVWAHRERFILELRAGAPPDMFSHLGQNWGLPIYNWDRMAANGYQWWKDRLRHASRYYDAYRIDHVLGFFRVWAIPAENSSGLLGWFVPSRFLSRERLNRLGFDDGRIRWLAEPHLSGNELRTACDPTTDVVISAVLQRIGDEDLYLFAPHIRGERDLRVAELPEPVYEWLVGRYGDRALIAVDEETYAPAWNFRSCSRYAQISGEEKGRFEEVVADLGHESETIWEEQARRLLGFMRESTDMLPCAEDLGVIPRVVPKVLEELTMLGLRIPRWARLWDQSGQPYIPVDSYPFLSVCAPSVHDTSTLRGWWTEEDGLDEFWTSLGLPGSAPRSYTPETARQVVAAVLACSSSICVLQIQDILALSDSIALPHPDEERVNVPGTVNDFNWNYRMPITLGELAGLDDLRSSLGRMVQERKARSTGS